MYIIALTISISHIIIIIIGSCSSSSGSFKATINKNHNCCAVLSWVAGCVKNENYLKQFIIFNVN